MLALCSYRDMVVLEVIKAQEKKSEVFPPRNLAFKFKSGIRVACDTTGRPLLDAEFVTDRRTFYTGFSTVTFDAFSRAGSSSSSSLSLFSVDGFGLWALDETK